MNDWTTNWKQFGEEVQSSLSEGESINSIAIEIGAQRVKWIGLLSEKDLDPNAPMIVIEMEPYSLKLQDGKHALLPNLVIPLQDDAVSEWVDVPIGAQVVFTATFAESQSFLPPIRLTILNSGRAIVSLRLIDGHYVSNLEVPENT